MKPFNTKPNHCRHRGLIVVLIMITWCAVVMAIEEPPYQVLQQEGKLELRAYDPMIIAEVVVAGDMKQASNRGFRLLADFIFGNNAPSQQAKAQSNAGAMQGGSAKISMTAPVTMEQALPGDEKIAMTTPVTLIQTDDKASANAQWRMHFVMPSGYTMATLPRPNNPQVQIRRVPATTYAVIRFSGFSGAKKVNQKTEELLAWMKQHDWQATGQAELARYNPPITPPFLRRNEVMIPVSK